MDIFYSTANYPCMGSLSALNNNNNGSFVQSIIIILIIIIKTKDNFSKAQFPQNEV